MLTFKKNENVVVDICWLLMYLTEGDYKFVTILLELGIIPPLVILIELLLM